MGNGKQAKEQVREESTEVVGVDDFAKSAFAAMGVAVTPSIAVSYQGFKALKDKLQPGRLKPADFVTCVMLAGKVTDG